MSPVLRVDEEMLKFEPKEKEKISFENKLEKEFEDVEDKKNLENFEKENLGNDIENCRKKGSLVLYKDFYFYLFLFSCIGLLILQNLGYLDTNSLIILLNVFGFVILFEKVYNNKNKINK